MRTTTTGERPVGGEVAVLLESLDRAFDRTSWHGPNLRGGLRGVGATEAAWRPAPGRHSVAEQVLHAAYWKYVVRRRLLGMKRGSFLLKGSNWFPVADDLAGPSWRGHLRLLDTEHALLRSAVSGLSPSRLSEVPPGARPGAFGARALVLGAAAHDLYHAGQIQLLKRLRAGVETKFGP